MRHSFRFVGLAVVAALLPAGFVAASGTPRGAAPGRLIDAPDGQSQMELLSIEPGLAPSLMGVPLEGSVRIDDWPVAPGVRRTVVVTRHDVYAPDAKIVAIDRGREVEVPRSKLVFLWGTAEGDGATAVLITLDPDTAVVSGSSMSADGGYDLLAPAAGRPQHLLARDGALREGGADPGFQCGFSDLPEDAARERLREERRRSAGPRVLTSMHTGVLAVDTDNEFMSNKFADNTANATNYIAQLIVGLNAIYQRDLFVQMLQGYTILRLSTTPDPYAANAGGNADGAKLDEVSAYWNTNYTGIKRMLVMMLSGKQPTGGGWSGIAWVGGLCSSLHGSSFNQVSRTGTTAGSSDFQLVGHEIGHNFGSPHTHCTDTSATAGIQPIDFCNSQQCGTQWSPPSGQVCPANFTINPANGAPVANVRGTLMSYCHQLGGCGVTNIFHPQSVSIAVGPDVDAAVNQCIFPVGNPAPTVTSIAPTSGPATGGTAVTLTGTNFRSPASVAFADLGAGKGATGVVVVNATTITATTPAHTGGLKDVVVMNPDQQTGTLKNAFTYIQPVIVTSISPNGGTTAGGTPVTILGSAFLAPATVTLGGAAATAVSVVDATTITATTPAHAAGAVNVVVQSNAQTSTLGSGYFYFTPLPPAKFYTLPPCRLVDTRNPATSNGLGGPALASSPGQRPFTLTNVCGIPTTAKAISVNLTVTGPTAPGFVSLFPGNGIAPTTSSINFGVGQTRANNAVVLLATDGTGVLRVLNGAPGTVHFILDVNGYLQ